MQGERFSETGSGLEFSSMQNFVLWARPWWVNLLLLIPAIAYLGWRRKELLLSWRQLAFITSFALAFGFVEAAAVVYLRAAVGLLPGYTGTVSDLQHASAGYEQAKSIVQFPTGLLTIEVFREAATMIMLVSLAMLAASKTRERWAVFLWAFAVWDITYYAGLWATVRWPASLTDLDVLFLIPVPWLSQVWFPILVSGLTLLAIGMAMYKRGCPREKEPELTESP